MRNITAALLVMMIALAAPLALADNHTGDNTTADINTTAEIDVDTEASAGITPDSALYGIDIALDKMRLAMTRNPEARAEKALLIAEERLQEVRAMAEERRSEALDKAQERHAEFLARAEAAVTDVDAEGGEAEARVGLEESARLRVKIQNHAERVEQVHERILERQADRMNETQIAHLEEVFAKISANAAQVDERVALKKEHARTRLKVRANLTDEEVAEVEAEVDQEAGLDALLAARADNLRARLKYRMEVQERAVDQRSERARTELRERYEEQLDRIEQDLERTRERLERRVERRDKSGSEELEIEIETETEDDKTKTKIKVEYGDNKYELEVEGTDRADVIAAVSEATGLSEDEVRALITSETRVRMGDSEVREKIRVREDSEIRVRQETRTDAGSDDSASDDVDDSRSDDSDESGSDDADDSGSDDSASDDSDDDETSVEVEAEVRV